MLSLPKNTPKISLILHPFSLIFTYCLFVQKELVMAEIFLLDFRGVKNVTEWQFLLIFLKRVEKDPLLRPQIRAKDSFS